MEPANFSALCFPDSQGEKKEHGTFVATDSDFLWYIYLRNGKTSDDARRQYIDYIDDYIGHGITDLSLCIFCQHSVTPSDVWTWLGDKNNWTAEGGYPVDYTNEIRVKAVADYYNNGGCDPVGVMIDELRNIGIKPWLTFRMNDAHYHGEQTAWIRGAEYYRFEKAEYMVYGNDNGYFDTCFNFEYAEVRGHYLAYLKEQIDRYDVDGVDLDFMREIFCFEYWKKDASYYCDIMTGFISKVKKIIEEKEKRVGHRIKLLVRIPRDIETCRIFGFDAREWVKRGIVDALAPSPKTINDNNIPFDEWARLVRGTGVELYAGQELNLSRVWENPSNTAETAKGYAAAAYAAGADKIYLSNFFVTDTIRANGAWEAVSSPEKALEGVRRNVLTMDVETDYVPKGSENYFALPVILAPGESVPVVTSEISAKEKVTVYCTVLMKSGIPAPALYFNGMETALTEETGDIYYDSGKGKTFAYVLTGRDIPAGTQEISFGTEEDAKIDLLYLEIKVESRN